jgi:hypothetical protein
MTKYHLLGEFLRHRKSDHWQATFSNIEKILGFQLPVSARIYQAWWANQHQGQRTQCSSWMDAGWEVRGLNLAAETVSFYRLSDPVPKGSLPSKLSHRTNLQWNDVVVSKSEHTKVSDVSFSWGSLGTASIDEKGRIRFPKTAFGPAVYRIELVSPSSPLYYFGETDEISLRLQQYRTPNISQTTNLRLNRLIIGCIEASGTVGISVAMDATLAFENSSANADFSKKHQRLLFESAAIAAALESNAEVLNR